MVKVEFFIILGRSAYQAGRYFNEILHAKIAIPIETWLSNKVTFSITGW